MALMPGNGFVSSRARDYAGPGDGGDPAHHLDVHMFADVYLLTTKVDILGVYLTKPPLPLMT